MDEQEGSLSIGAFAKATGVGVETIRFYQRKGLLPEPERIQGRIRRYDNSDIGRLRFIKSAQRLGFSLDEVAGLLRLDQESDCARARELAQQKLGDVRAELAQLHKLETILQKLVQDCDASLDKRSCALIAALQSCHCATRD
ncbi:MerR family transcriptional regulator [Variovorax paradoxus]|uniref:MerR family transcriptional regulator n=1 Tax=Variovorax paradoxus TaxID=34073 RepID=UPI0027886D19|nr:MerR family transcriptional regulator [Variovorax paradoxus]MDQ0586631.1 MerR family mercuric resistance operon transcriptional regulator [Variovorax paradoxus]